MKSMTGYGRAEKESKGGITFKAEIKSVNRKQFDLKLNIPSELSEYELQIRKIISDAVSRGSVVCYISIILGGESLRNSVSINKEILKAYIDSANDLAMELSLPQNLSISDLYNLPKSVEIVNPEISSDPACIDDLFLTVKKALENFNKTRTAEGEYLKTYFLQTLDKLASTLLEIEPLTAGLPAFYHARLLDRVKKNQAAAIVNEELFVKEIVMLSDKCDVTEEITRLKSHFEQLEKLVNLENTGRNLDFLIQEIQREINTMGVKAASTDISPFIVEFKTLVEKVREQVQNIE